MKRIALAGALALVATPALAHVGTGAHFSALTGFEHPFGGLDHVAAMVAVGLWSALGGGRRVWIWPVAFVSAMIGGALLGHAGVEIPLVEPAIAASLVVLGLLVALAVHAPVAVGAGVIALFAIVHGHAHGAEAPDASFAAYVLGFATATAILHAVGIAIGLGAEKLVGRVPVRILGAATAALGLVLLVG
jgi:urease accessory protein